jgi:hypothetical protein
MPPSIERARLLLALGMIFSVTAAGGCAADSSPSEIRPHPGDGGTDGPTCVPTWHDASAGAWHPPRGPTSACTPEELEAYYAACFSTGATKASCAAFESDAGHASCTACMITEADAPALGPVLRWPNETVQADVAGCLALVDGDSGPSGCAAAMFAQQQCEYAACGFCFGQTHMDACIAAADLGLCKSFVENAACAEASRYDPCFFIGFSQNFYGLGLRFCSAGGDAGADASAE